MGREGKERGRTSKVDGKREQREETKDGNGRKGEERGRDGQGRKEGRDEGGETERERRESSEDGGKTGREEGREREAVVSSFPGVITRDKFLKITPRSY